MPEIGEVARIVHFLRTHLVGKTISSVRAEKDDIVYGKVGCSAEDFQKAMKGKKVVGANQQGKYFWLEMNQPPHPVMHLGMTGWIHFSNDNSTPYRPPKTQEAEWPPRFLKFLLNTDESEVAFVDARRLARIRLLDVPADQLRRTTPLKENGPDPIVDKGKVTVEWLTALVQRKRVPIKALLLDQANISGIGNWVGDEILFQARIHPEQYSNSLSNKQIAQLHDKLIEVCTIACETLGESSKFPDNWLMTHRWNKGKKGENKLPTGEKIEHLTVGGRTSAIVPSLQKKTGAVAGDLDDGSDAEGEPAKKTKKVKAEAAPTANERESKPSANDKRKRAREIKAEVEDEPEATPKKRKAAVDLVSTPKSKSAAKKEIKPPTPGSRRSSRHVSGKAR